MYTQLFILFIILVRTNQNYSNNNDTSNELVVESFLDENKKGKQCLRPFFRQIQIISFSTDLCTHTHTLKHHNKVEKDKFIPLKICN